MKLKNKSIETQKGLDMHAMPEAKGFEAAAGCEIEVSDLCAYEFSTSFPDVWEVVSPKEGNVNG